MPHAAYGAFAPLSQGRSRLAFKGPQEIPKVVCTRFVISCSCRARGHRSSPILLAQKLSVAGFELEGCSIAGQVGELDCGGGFGVIESTPAVLTYELTSELRLSHVFFWLATGRERFNVGWCVSLFSGRDVSNITISHWKQCNQGDKIRQPDKIAALTVQLCSLQPLWLLNSCQLDGCILRTCEVDESLAVRGDCCTAYTAYLPFLGWPPKSALLLFDICPGKAPLVWSLQSLAYIPTPLLAWLYTIHIEAKVTRGASNPPKHTHIHFHTGDMHHRPSRKSGLRHRALPTACSVPTDSPDIAWPP
eukprot:1155081-Pelagomonas_calceolata.AAC.9